MLGCVDRVCRKVLLIGYVAGTTAGRRQIMVSLGCVDRVC